MTGLLPPRCKAWNWINDQPNWLVKAIDLAPPEPVDTEIRHHNGYTDLYVFFDGGFPVNSAWHTSSKKIWLRLLLGTNYCRRWLMMIDHPWFWFMSTCSDSSSQSSETNCFSTSIPMIAAGGLTVHLTVT